MLRELKRVKDDDHVGDSLDCGQVIQYLREIF